MLFILLNFIGLMNNLIHCKPPLLKTVKTCQLNKVNGFIVEVLILFFKEFEVTRFLYTIWQLIM
jgi:hypothetical protein